MDEKWVLTIMGFDKMGLDKTLDLAKKMAWPKWDLASNGNWPKNGAWPKKWGLTKHGA